MLFKKKEASQVACEKTLEEKQTKLLEQLSFFTQNSTKKIEDILENLVKLVMVEEKLQTEMTEDNFNKLQNKIHFTLNEIYSDLHNISVARFSVKTDFILIKREEKEDGKHE